MRRKLGNILLALISMLIVALFYTKVNKGFSIQEIHSLTPLHFKSPQLSNSQEALIRTALSQPYHYLAKGCQFYAFESKDGRYIIKFLKYKHLRSEPYEVLSQFPLPLSLKKSCLEKIATRQERIKRLFSSINIAYEDLSAETGLLYHHFNRDPFLKGKLKLINPLGITQKIDLDEYDFLLQEKALAVKTCFEASQNNPEEIRKKIEQLIKVVVAQCKKGVVNADRAFVQNVGFCLDGKKAFLVDLGQFIKDDSIKNEAAIEDEVSKRLGSLRSWMQVHFPTLLTYVEEVSKSVYPSSSLE